MDYIKVIGLTTDEIKDILKEWIKLYPDSFNPDVDFQIYKTDENKSIIKLHEDISSLAVSLILVYISSAVKCENTDEPQGFATAYITVDDTEILKKQNLGKRAMIFANRNNDSFDSVSFLLDDDYCLDYDFEKKPQPNKNCDKKFEEEALQLGDLVETVRVGDVVQKKIDKVLEPEGLTPQKLLIYILCGIMGLSIGFLIVFLTK